MIGLGALATRLLLSAGMVAAAIAAWQWREHVVYQRGVSDIVAIAARAASAAELVNLATGEERKLSAAKAEFQHLERMKAREQHDANERDRHAAVERRLARLRESAVAGDRGAAVDAGGACSAEHKLDRERIERLLAEGQQLAIEGAGLVAEAGDLVAAGEGGLASAASLINLARDWARAVKLGEPAPIPHRP